jgi:hypothetical protein
LRFPFGREEPDDNEGGVGMSLWLLILIILLVGLLVGGFGYRRYN